MVNLPKYKADRPNWGMNKETSYLGANCTPQNGTVIIPLIGVMEASSHGAPIAAPNLVVKFDGYFGEVHGPTCKEILGQ